ncbi:MAG: class I SAM-dependent methyltransferase [Flavobacteriia bacterium]|jgi:cyclopropane fatty-acyl-phospholipid synthase-like methyltransferase
MSSKEWFADWFDTPYYHILYKNRNDEEAAHFIENLIEFIQLDLGSRVLDLACGKGRHSVTLNKLGYNVLGVDLSVNSIERAKPFEKEGLKFAVHDMRQVIDGEKFDAIFNLFTSFGYFDSIEDNLDVIRSIHTMLIKNGYLVIDFMNAEKVISNLVLTEVKTVDGITFNIERKYDGKHIFKNIRFEADGQIHHYTERVQALKLDDFEQLLNETGFAIIRIFGDFSLNAYDAKTSDRLIITAKKL